MRKKRLLLIGLQLAVVAGFVFMALGSASDAAAVKSPDYKRMDRAGCGDAEYVFMGLSESQGACSQTCKSASFTKACFTNKNCFCK